MTAPPSSGSALDARRSGAALPGHRSAPGPAARGPASERCAGIEAFARGLIEAAADQACAVKINVAFFEAFGADGWAALERVRRDVPAGCALHPRREARRHRLDRRAVRGIGLFGHLDADAVTLSPYLGEDAIDPFLADADRLVYLLARTSNPSAGTIPGARGGRRAGAPATWRAGRPIDGAMAGSASSWGRRHPPSWRRSGPRCRARHSWCRAWAPRAATWTRRPCAARTGRGRRAWCRSRAASPAPREGPTGARRPPRPPGALADRMRDAVLHSEASSAAAANHGGS